MRLKEFPCELVTESQDSYSDTLRKLEIPVDSNEDTYEYRKGKITIDIDRIVMFHSFTDEETKLYFDYGETTVVLVPYKEFKKQIGG